MFPQKTFLWLHSGQKWHMRISTEIELYQGSVSKTEADFLEVQSSSLCGIKRKEIASDLKFNETMWPFQWKSSSVSQWKITEMGFLLKQATIDNHKRYLKGAKRKVFKEKRESEKSQQIFARFSSRSESCTAKMTEKDYWKVWKGPNCWDLCSFFDGGFAAWKAGRRAESQLAQLASISRHRNKKKQLFWTISSLDSSQVRILGVRNGSSSVWELLMRTWEI